MTTTLAEAITLLTKGDELAWDASGQFKGGTIHLSTPGQRRLFGFLINKDPDLVESADEVLFDGLTATWDDEDTDPADEKFTAIAAESDGPWRLKRIEANGFGGLNTPDGPTFTLDVGGESWSIEGYNGSGKTSLTSLILWAMTGTYNREQDGPHRDEGRREPVCDPDGKQVGTWPPLVTYPLDIVGLKKDAVVWARLTFTNPAGETATAERKTTSPLSGDPTLDATIDPRLLSSPALIEAGLLMPMRIGHIGFGEKSRALYQALKMLTGLDQLASVASGAAALGHRSRPVPEIRQRQWRRKSRPGFHPCHQRRAYTIKGYVH